MVKSNSSLPLPFWCIQLLTDNWMICCLVSTFVKHFLAFPSERNSFLQCHAGLSLLCKLSCINPFSATRWAQPTNHQVWQLHHCTSPLMSYVTSQLFFADPNHVCFSNTVTNFTHVLNQGFMLCLQQLACIFSIVACLSGNDELEDASQILSCLSDAVFCTLSNSNSYNFQFILITC